MCENIRQRTPISICFPTIIKFLANQHVTHASLFIYIELSYTLGGCFIYDSMASRSILIYIACVKECVIYGPMDGLTDVYGPTDPMDWETYRWMQPLMEA